MLQRYSTRRQTSLSGNGLYDETSDVRNHPRQRLARSSWLPFPCAMLSADQQAAPDWREARLRRHADYVRAYEAGRREQSPSMAYVCRLRAPLAGKDEPQPEKPTIPGVRVGLTVGRVLGPAVLRNRIKRRMREAVRAHLALLPSEVDLVLLPRKSVATLPYPELSQEVAAIFGRVSDRIERVGRTAVLAEQAHRLANPTPRGAKKGKAMSEARSKAKNTDAKDTDNKVGNKTENQAESRVAPQKTFRQSELSGTKGTEGPMALKVRDQQDKSKLHGDSSSPRPLAGPISAQTAKEPGSEGEV